MKSGEFLEIHRGYFEIPEVQEEEEEIEADEEVEDDGDDEESEYDHDSPGEKKGEQKHSGEKKGGQKQSGSNRKRRSSNRNQGTPEQKSEMETEEPKGGTHKRKMPQSLLEIYQLLGDEELGQAEKSQGLSS